MAERRGDGERQLKEMGQGGGQRNDSKRKKKKRDTMEKYRGGSEIH